MYLIGSKKKFDNERVGKTGEKTINKAYTKYRQGKLIEKCEKLEKL